MGGNFTSNKNSSKATNNTRLGRDDVLAVVVNLDAKGPNANTDSLFCNGVRLSQPQVLPESMRGKELFPVVAFKNMLVHVNFGPHQLAALPFKCRMLGDASQKDATVTKEEAPKGGKQEVVVPVGLPDEGAFMWLDMWLQKNPGYTELSDRSLLAWAEKSGLWRRDGYEHRACNDKPDLSLGIYNVDDGSVGKAIKSIAPIQNRNYVVMELKSNLIKEERETLIKKFSAALFKRVAQVVVGEPTLEFRKKVHEIALQQKQEASDKEFKVKQDQEKLKHKAEQNKIKADWNKKKVEKDRKIAEKAAKKKAAEEKKAAEAAKKVAEKEAKKAAKQKAKEEKEAADKAAEEAKAKAAAEGGDAAAADGEKKDEEKKDDEKKEEAAAEKKEEEKKEEVDVDSDVEEVEEKKEEPG